MKKYGYCYRCGCVILMEDDAHPNEEIKPVIFNESLRVYECPRCKTWSAFNDSNTYFAATDQLKSLVEITVQNWQQLDEAQKVTLQKILLEFWQDACKIAVIKAKAAIEQVLSRI